MAGIFPRGMRYEKRPDPLARPLAVFGLTTPFIIDNTNQPPGPVFFYEDQPQALPGEQVRESVLVEVIFNKLAGGIKLINVVDLVTRINLFVDADFLCLGVIDMKNEAVIIRTKCVPVRLPGHVVITPNIDGGRIK